MNSLLEVRGVSKIYKHNKMALNNFSINLEGGQIVGLLGPNGSGKSTLIKMINGLLVPNSGMIYVDGKPVGIDTKKIISYLPERTYFDKQQTVKELLSYFADFYEDFDMKKAEAMLADLGVNQNAKMKELSKGTQEKVQLVLVMSRKALLYILDEPIGGVDPAARDYILNTILKNYNPNGLVLISTHLISDVENTLDRVIFIKNGELILNENADDLRVQRRNSVDEIFREVFAC
ncbi:MAG: ABC transporter ATP-binding protein [Lachnospiraceae bacterium]|jgi:ABC-2 type transport system ATP-binding protein|nr:ABC transporter ATP-binding protein [Lachnospiraceae bacterium]